MDANYVKRDRQDKGVSGETDLLPGAVAAERGKLWRRTGVDTFIEIGPGKTLTSFVKKICKDAVTVNIEKWEDMEKLA